MDNPVKMDDLGVPPFQETSIYNYIIIYIIIYIYYYFYYCHYYHYYYYYDYIYIISKCFQQYISSKSHPRHIEANGASGVRRRPGPPCGHCLPRGLSLCLRAPGIPGNLVERDGVLRPDPGDFWDFWWDFWESYMMFHVKKSVFLTKW